MIEAYLPQDRTQLLKRLQDFCTVARWHESGVDMFSKAAGKAVGIEKFLNLHNLIKEEIIAFGDAENDIQMLLYAGIGVAMGNADQ
ncbi:MAG: HAD hydrolase family protein, partial [Spirochaetales bacterium]